MTRVGEFAALVSSRNQCTAEARSLPLSVMKSRAPVVDAHNVPAFCGARAIHETAPPDRVPHVADVSRVERSEEHTSELQSRQYLVCRLLLEKKKRRSAKRS